MKDCIVANILETLMIISFGASWPVSLIRSYKSKSTKGKSVIFSILIWIGYLCGIASKILSHTFNLAFYFYFPNILMVTADILMYFKNRKYELLMEQIAVGVHSEKQSAV